MFFELLLYLTSIVSLICLILTLIKLFPAKGLLWGIFGIFCGIYTFIWGWMNAGRFALQQVMIIWSISMVVSIIASVITTNS
ncbi:hypothetical protein GLO73106DRAFT_00006320 [Gloeocapsa sp. PCC 73106]|nr:hypothetical protein GLO73106DRAFT_00006320 [Gloeocapsa sp. PCC 73106]